MLSQIRQYIHSIYCKNIVICVTNYVFYIYVSALLLTCVYSLSQAATIICFYLFYVILYFSHVYTHTHILHLCPGIYYIYLPTGLGIQAGVICEHPVNAVNATGIPYCYSSCIATVLLQATCLNNIWLAATVPCLTFCH